MVALEEPGVIQVVKKFPTFLLWNPKVHFLVHNSQRIGPCPESDASSPHFSTLFPEDHSNIIFLCTC